MVFFNHATRQMTAKIVYYGPGLCGKTTNLNTIYAKTSQKARGEMVSLNTETDRTLFFDLLPMEVGILGGFKTKLQLYTVPGQVFYNSTRKLVLKGVDGIVFVADSQTAMLDANRESVQNLKDNLRELGLDLEQIPLVFQWNKRDLKQVTPVEELERLLNPNGRLSFQGIAQDGMGVFETLRGITRLALGHIKTHHLGEPAEEGEAPKAAVAEAPAPQPPPPPPSPVVAPPPVLEPLDLEPPAATGTDAAAAPDMVLSMDDLAWPSDSPSGAAEAPLPRVALQVPQWSDLEAAPAKVEGETPTHALPKASSLLQALPPLPALAPRQAPKAGPLAPKPAAPGLKPTVPSPLAPKPAAKKPAVPIMAPRIQANVQVTPHGPLRVDLPADLPEHDVEVVVQVKVNGVVVAETTQHQKPPAPGAGQRLFVDLRRG